MLIDIEPPIIGQSFGLAGRDITKLILSARGKGCSLFPVTEWPCHVYVANILDDDITKTLAIERKQTEVIAWGVIFRTLDDANAYAKGGPGDAASR